MGLAEAERTVSVAPPWLLPPPEADEVVVVLLQEVEVGIEIEWLRWVCWTHILQIAPGVGAG